MVIFFQINGRHEFNIYAIDMPLNSKQTITRYIVSRSSDIPRSTISLIYIKYADKMEYTAFQLCSAVHEGNEHTNLSIGKKS